jgi:hypothetical protein
VIVPLFYLMLDDLREFTARVWTTIFAKDPAPAPGGAAAGVGRASRAE